MLQSSPLTSSTSSTKKFRGSLARTIVLVLILLSIFPAILVGGVNIALSRRLVLEQTSSQMQEVINNQVNLLLQVMESNKTEMDTLAVQQDFQSKLDSVLQAPDEQERISREWDLWLLLSSYKPQNKAQFGTTFDQIMVIKPDGTAVSTTNRNWDFNELKVINHLIGLNGSFAAFNPAPLYANQLVVFSGTTVNDGSGKPLVTLIGASTSSFYRNILLTAKSAFQESSSYFLMEDDQLVTLNASGEFTSIQSNDLSQINEIKKLIKAGSGIGQYQSLFNIQVVSYAQNVPEIKIHLLVEVPQSVVYSQLNLQNPYNFGLLALAIIVSAVVAYFAALSMINPIRKLAELARELTSGDLSKRADIKRNDEIGLLAFSINSMLDQLSGLYRSLESKVEERSQQLRAASEVAQIATSATNQGEIIQRTTNLVIERYGFPYASIFLLDETGKFAILQEASGANIEKHPPRGYRILVGSGKLIGWVAAFNQSRIIADTEIDETKDEEFLLPNTRSEIGIPIAVGSQVLGVLNVQSEITNAFDADTASVLSTLATQVAIGLQNIRLVEGAQINLEETTLLYRTGRQITEATEENAIFQILENTFSKIPFMTGIFKIEKDHVHVVTLTDPKSPISTAHTQGVTLPLTKEILELPNKSPVLVEDLVRSSEYENLLLLFSRRGCSSAAIFTLTESGNLTYVFVLGSRRPSPLSFTAIQPFSNLAAMTASSFEKVHILQNLQKRLNELQTLANVSQAISFETDLARLYQVVHQQVAQTMGSDLGFVLAIYHAKDKTIEVPYLYEEEKMLSIPPFPLGEGLTSILINTRKSLMIVKDTERKVAELGARVVGKTAKSWLGVPLIVGGEVIGAMIVQDLNKEERFSESDLNLIETLAPQIAIAIRNVQLLNEMQQALTAYDQERFLLNSLLGNIPDQIYFKNAKGSFIRASDSFAKELKLLSPELLIGKTEFEFLEERQSTAIFQNEQEIISTGENQIGVVERKYDENGQEFFFLTSKIPMRDELGNIVGLLVISRDISELKLAEALAQQRADQLRTAAEIARDTANTLNVEEVLSKAVQLIGQRFGFYHAGIFLLDPLGEFAILREATGMAGQKMKEAGHKMAVGSHSLVGQTTQKGEPTVINDVRNETGYFANPLLPETNSELVIPLKVSNRVLGALDVQSKKLNAFPPETINIMQILADQIALAVLNATLFAKSQENLTQHRLLHQISTAATSSLTIDDALKTTVEGLRMAFANDRISIYLVNENNELEIRSSAGFKNTDIVQQKLFMGEGIVGRTALEKKPLRIDDTHTEAGSTINEEIRSQLAIPIIYSSKVLGVLCIESSAFAAYDENNQEILASLGNNLGAIISNTQLLTEIRRQVDHQRQIFEITNRIRRSLDIQSILQTSASEICKALNARKAYVEITAGKPIEALIPKDNSPDHGGNDKEIGK